ncbi:unnamed protein product, partial [Didymodactylos carnosus]
RLEEAISNAEDRKDDPYVRSRVRDIFVRSISPIDYQQRQSPLDFASSTITTGTSIPSITNNRRTIDMHNSSQIADENRYLNEELNRVETALNSTRAEKDELSIRYNALSDRLEQSLRAQGVDTSDNEPERGILVQQNIDLRRKLEEEHQNYKRKLQTYQDGQQKQAQLVQKLQQKILQYKTKCSELQLSLDQQKADIDRAKIMGSYRTDGMRVLAYENSLRSSEEQDIAAITLEEEKHKSASIEQVNAMLRQQLDHANAVNQQLTDDLHNITAEFQRVRDEISYKTRDWHEEARMFNEYYNKEHNLIYELWRDVVSFRKQFTELKGSTERDLTRVRNDLTQTGRSLTTACLGFLSNTKSIESQGQILLDRERGDKVTLEGKIREKTLEIDEWQSRAQELTLLNEKLRMQLAEKESTIVSLTRVAQSIPRSYVPFDDIDDRKLIDCDDFLNIL